jgi:tetratricopeptide (TPR) repeat protein
VASLAGDPASRTRRTLAELTRAHLVTERTPGRYAFHDLLLAYAAEQARTLDTEVERRTALRRVIDHYLHTAYAADRLLDPHREPIILEPAGSGTTSESPADHAQALSWFTVEHPVLLALLQQAASAGFDRQAWQLAWSLSTFQHRRGHWHEWAATQHIAVAAARRLADRPAQAYAHRSLGGAYTRLMRFDEARDHLWKALDLYREFGRATGLAHTHLNIVWVCDWEDRHDQALAHAQQALALYRGSASPVGLARALNAAGWCHARLGDHRQGVSLCREALALFQEVGDRMGAAAAWDSLGYAQHQLGEHRHAIACYQHALDLDRDLDDRFGESGTLTRLGDTHAAAGDLDAARANWQHALGILDQLRHPDADQVRARLEPEGLEDPVLDVAR